MCDVRAVDEKALLIKGGFGWIVNVQNDVKSYCRCYKRKKPSLSKEGLGGL